MLSVPGANKINKSRYSLGLHIIVSVNIPCFFVGFFLVSFDIDDVSNKFVSARIIHVIHLKISAD